MAAIMKELREEHRNIARLLGVLERELALFDRAEKPDYDVLAAVADYFKGFPERSHHPKEDLVLDRLREVDPEAAAEIGDLEIEHGRISALARTFQDAITNILRDAEMSRAAFHDTLKTFIAEQRKHMEMEEAHFFPAAEEALSDADWKAIEAAASREQDPLSPHTDDQSFAKLYADIMAWEKENQAASG